LSVVLINAETEGVFHRFLHHLDRTILSPIRFGEHFKNALDLQPVLVVTDKKVTNSFLHVLLLGRNNWQLDAPVVLLARRSFTGAPPA
jgi:hypothetical protein